METKIDFEFVLFALFFRTVLIISIVVHAMRDDNVDIRRGYEMVKGNEINLQNICEVVLLGEVMRQINSSI